MSRISSIVFDEQERPLRATIITTAGTVKMEWSDVCGDWCWRTSGTLEAKKLAVSVIQRIERILRET
jgi:deoxyhypusine synthase